MNVAGIAATSVAVAIPLAMRLLAKLFPAKPTAAAAPSFDALAAKYRRWDGILAVMILAVAAPASFVLYRLLVWIANWCAGLLPRADMVLAPITPAYWFLPALMLGLLCGIVVALGIVRRLLGERNSEYEAYWARASKMDSVKANRVVMEVCAGLCAMLIFLGLRTYVLVSGDALIVNGYFSLGETRYHLADIRKIETAPRFIAPNGDTVARREYVVTFADGRRWTTDIAADPDQATKRALVQLLSRRSGVPVEELAVFPRGTI